MEIKIVYAKNEDVGKRLDVFLAAALDITRSAAVKLIEDGNVTLGESTPDKKRKVALGEEFAVTLPAPEPSEAMPEDILLDIIHEDNDLLVINKPKGMVVHPSAGNNHGTLVNALLYHCGNSLSGIGGVIRPGIVHRIDKDTTGLLVVAKNDKTHLKLSEQLLDHTVSRIYHALVCGNIKEDEGTINAPIGRSQKDRKKMAVVRGSEAKSREAVTHFTVLERFGDFTYIKCVLETGRTHQIRVHMASIGHPIMGDTIYGGGKSKFEAQSKSLIDGQCLHAKELTFIHPATNKQEKYECPLPDYFEALLTKLRKIYN